MLDTQPTTVMDRHGHRSNAYIAICGNCGFDLWEVFQVEGENILHIQCATCDAVYCAGHEDCRYAREPSFPPAS